MVIPKDSGGGGGTREKAHPADLKTWVKVLMKITMEIEEELRNLACSSREGGGHRPSDVPV